MAESPIHLRQGSDETPELPREPVDSLAAAVTVMAARIAEQFNGCQMTVRGHRAVHAIAMVRWMAGAVLPAPACNVGFAGFAAEDLRPTPEPVSCQRCLHLTAGRAVSSSAPIWQGQLVLPLEL